MSNESDGERRVAVAIGNTHVRAAICVNGEISDRIVVETERALAEPAALDPILALSAQTEDCRVVISSVVPTVLSALRSGLECQSNVTALVVGSDIPLPMPMDVESPESVGVDRVCAAAAAFARVKQACVVVDFGTAITVNAVGDNGAFLGGAILPGLGLAARALAEHTAALPLVEVCKPGSVLGRTTEAALTSGLFYGARGAIREIVEAMAASFGKWPTLLFTGGDAVLVGEDCDFADVVVPDLGLLGLELADRSHMEADL